jgi:two-component system response regulator FlrC
LIEDMLFGHEKGAFTGAHREQKGLFEQAQGGTLFLDEIGEMPMHLQSKLLRVLQERQLTRLGGQTTIQLNVRIVAATNKDLKKAIVEREFREDLYYRIATFRMRLLPLAERPGDIIPLAMQCLLQHDKKPWQLLPQTQAQLLQYPWPGNVRELENVMRRAMVLCADHVVTPGHLMFDDWLTASTLVAAPAISSLPLVSSLPAATDVPSAVPNPLLFERAMPEEAPMATDLNSAARMNEHQVIMATLANTPSKTEAAKVLGISPRTLRYKLAQLREHGLGMASAAC